MCKVRNITARRERGCYCGTWLKHWENYSDIHSRKCSNVGCENQAVIGAHVKVTDSNDPNWYIVPLCEECNKLRDEFHIEMPLVSANVFETCG